MPNSAHPANIAFDPIAGTLGAEVVGVDLGETLAEPTLEALRAALAEHLVLVFPATGPLAAGDLIRLMRAFGEPDDHPFAGSFKLPRIDGNPYVFGFVKEASDRAMNLGGFWHADVTCRARPHKAALLYAKDCPPAGGDTMFANQYLSYESLSRGMKRMLERLSAVHASTLDYGRAPSRFGAVGRDHVPEPGDARHSIETYDAGANPELEESVHPVVRVHPDTGRKHLYVNRAFTNRFDGWTKEESRPLMEFLWNHAARPEFTCRVRWHRDAVVLWDNRCCQHYAINDYFGHRREMHRVAVHEDN